MLFVLLWWFQSDEIVIFVTRIAFPALLGGFQRLSVDFFFQRFTILVQH